MRVPCQAQHTQSIDPFLWLTQAAMEWSRDLRTFINFVQEKDGSGPLLRETIPGDRYLCKCLRGLRILQAAAPAPNQRSGAGFRRCVFDRKWRHWQAFTAFGRNVVSEASVRCLGLLLLNLELWVDLYHKNHYGFRAPSFNNPILFIFLADWVIYAAFRSTVVCVLLKLL